MPSVWDECAVFPEFPARRPLSQFTSLTLDWSELRSLRVNREGMNCLRMYLPYLCAFHLFDESKENKTSERAFANMCSEWYNECMKLLLHVIPLHGENSGWKGAHTCTTSNALTYIKRMGSTCTLTWHACVPITCTMPLTSISGT